MRLIILLTLINSNSSINYIPNCLNCSNDNDFSVLVLTETADYVHESIDTGIELIKKIGDRNKFYRNRSKSHMKIGVEHPEGLWKL